MKILLISDFGIEHNSGGAQRSNQLIIDKGLSRGHDIVTFHYDSKREILSDQYDVIISSNLEIISSIYPDLVKSIPLANNHIRLEHDSNLYWNNEFRKYFWDSCKLSFFLTDFHYSFFLEYYGNIFKNVRIVPDPIDECFINLGLDRSSKIGYVGFMHELKGTQNFIDYAEKNQDKKFLVAGWGDEKWINKINTLSNIEYIGKLDHKDMAAFYNSIKSIYYNPVCNEPFCRSVGEALMCGVEIIGDSEKIGSLNMYRSDPNFRSKCINAADSFWEIIENDINTLPN